MSQAGSLSGGGGGTADIQKINVQAGTTPVVATNNTITFNGAVVAAGSNPVLTNGTAPATMALEVQTSQAIASTDATKIGLSAFNSSQFSVDANGFVSSTVPSGITTIDGDSGSTTGSTVTFTGTSSGSTVLFTASGSTVKLDVSDANDNTVIGLGSGVNPIGRSSTVIGQGSGSIVLGDNNTILGQQCASFCVGSQNVLLGGGVGNDFVNSNNNIAIGIGALAFATTANYNIAIGYQVGSSYSSSESSNILIGKIPGTTGESNTIRIGNQGNSSGLQNSCYIAGIAGVSVSNTNMVVIDTTTGKLGSQAVPSGSGALTLIQTQTATNQTTLNFTTGITATYNSYQLLSNAVTDPLTSGTDLVTRISTDGGATYITTNYFAASTGLQCGFLDGSTNQTSFTQNLYNVTSGAGFVASYSSGNRSGFGTITSGDNYTIANVVVNALQIGTDDGSAFSGTFSLYGISQ